jgi:hypothetical protein
MNPSAEAIIGGMGSATEIQNIYEEDKQEISEKS